MPDTARSSARLADAKRLADLDATGILDSPVEESFNRLTRLAARVIDAPVALASFVDDRRQFFKSRFGEIAEPWKSRRGTLLSHSFCQYVVERGTPLVIDDARHHPLVCNNLAIDDLGVAAYAGVPIHSPSGSVLGSLCVIDTEERSWTDEEVAVLVDLAQGVDTEIALRLARERAEAANRAKSTFLANMSHELRTPLSAILGLASLLLATRLDERQAEYLEIIDSSGRDLLSMLDELLDLSRIEAGHLEIQRRPFRLADVVGGSLQGLLHRARDKGLEVSLEVAPEVPKHVSGDEARVRQLLVNLVGNALKFTREGEIAVRVAPVPAAGSGPPDGAASIRFEVEDTGVGIQPSVRRRIFEPFEQGDSSVSKRFGGAGLGLSIVAQLVSLMGGEISVDSEPGRGSLFRVDLPLQAAEEVAEAAEGSDGRPGGAERPNSTPDLETPDFETPNLETPSLRVLLVDDNEVNLLVGRRILELQGHRVVTASGGLEALDLVGGEAGNVAGDRAGDHEFDVILMDLQMPDLDGIETTRRLRGRGGSAADTPVVALTAHAMNGDREACLAAGLDEFLTKPLRVEDLERLLGEIASRTGGGDPKEEFDLPASSYEDLLRNVGGDEDLLAEVAVIWCRQQEETLEAVLQALDELDHAGLARLAHKVGGTVLALGDERLAEASRELHEAAQSEAPRVRIESCGRRFLAAFDALTRCLSPIASVDA